MKRKITIWAVYIGAVLSVFLPWFSYNPTVMGYCWGYSFVKWFAVPMIVFAITMAVKRRNKVIVTLSELSLVTNLFILIYAFGGWQEVHNIGGTFNLAEGFITATPYFWLSVVLYLSLFWLFQWWLLTGGERTE